MDFAANWAMNWQNALRSLTLVFFLSLAGKLQGQIVNIEKQRIATDSTGWFGSAYMSFAGTKTTVSAGSLYAGGVVEYKSPSNKDLWLLITDFSLVKGEGEDFSNTGFGHLRYNRKLGEIVRWEIFAQMQYNELTKVDQRILGGTGLRFKLLPYELTKLYMGVAYMYEYEVLLDPILYENNHRLSSYLSFTLLPAETVTLTSTVYMQPLIEDFSDYKLTNETSFDVEITNKFSLAFTFRYGYDSQPPFDVPKSIFAFANTLEIEF